MVLSPAARQMVYCFNLIRRLLNVAKISTNWRLLRCKYASCFCRVQGLLILLFRKISGCYWGCQPVRKIHRWKRTSYHLICVFFIRIPLFIGNNYFPMRLFSAAEYLSPTISIWDKAVAIFCRAASSK